MNTQIAISVSDLISTKTDFCYWNSKHFTGIWETIPKGSLLMLLEIIEMKQGSFTQTPINLYDFKTDVELLKFLYCGKIIYIPITTTEIMERCDLVK